MPSEPRIDQDKPPLGKLQFKNTRGNGVYYTCDGATAGGAHKAHAPAHQTTEIDVNQSLPSINVTFYKSNGANAPSIGSILVPATGGLPAGDHANGAVLLFKDDAVVGANCGSIESS